MFNTKRELLHQIKILQDRLEDMIKANEDLQRQMRTVEHSVGLQRLRHNLEIEEARAQGRRQGEEIVRDADRRHSDDVIIKLETLNKEIMARLPTVNVDKAITRNDTESSGISK